MTENNGALNRRAMILGCSSGMLLALSGGCAESAHPPRKISLGSVTAFPMGMTPRPLERIAVLRDGSGLGAMSLVCTHQTCAVTPQVAGGYVCPCHGSEFDAVGGVRRGPAVRPLPWFALEVDATGSLWVDFDRIVDPYWRLSVEHGRV